MTTTSIDPIEIAMEAQASGGSPGGAAEAVLRKHSVLIGWQIASERAGFVLKLLLGVGGILLAIALAVMVWEASHARGVVIEAFSTPPDFADKGLTGEVVAGQLQDRLMRLQAQTISARAGDTYASDWGRDIKVVIPQTGVSLGELQRYLRQWLGHETHVNGEIFRTPKGLSLTVRANGEAGDPVDGSEADLDALLNAGAQALYKKTQPYRWAVYISRTPEERHRWESEARPIVEQLAASGPAQERGWAHNNLRANVERIEDSMAYARRGLEIAPRTAILMDNLGGTENALGRVEAARGHLIKSLAMFKSRDRGGYREEIAAEAVPRREATIAVFTGDYQAAARWNGQGLAIATDPENRLAMRASESRILSYLHQPGAAGALLDQQGSDGERVAQQLVASLPTAIELSRFIRAREQADWAEAYRQAASVQAVIDAIPAGERGAKRLGDLAPAALWPALAEALANLGRLDEAKALAAKTPLDCYNCLRTRGKIAALAGDAREADRWFAEAARQAPHFNAAQTEWGQALLARGQADAAIAQFQAANKIGPRFADPLEGWGEALLAKGDAKSAAAKFEQAAKVAPQWGRLHLKWGLALARLGQADAAKARWAAAARMDLTPADRAELAKLSAGR